MFLGEIYLGDAVNKYHIKIQNVAKHICIYRIAYRFITFLFSGDVRYIQRNGKIFSVSVGVKLREKILPQILVDFKN